MQKTISRTRPLLAGVALAGMCLLGACESSSKSIDNPKDGDTVSLAVGQALTVILTDMNGAKADWSMTSSDAKALTLRGHTAKPPVDGSLPLDRFEFVGAAPGEQRLTFAYLKPGQPVGPDDAMTITVTVK